MWQSPESEGLIATRGLSVELELLARCSNNAGMRHDTCSTQQRYMHYTSMVQSR